MTAVASAGTADTLAAACSRPFKGILWRCRRTDQPSGLAFQWSARSIGQCTNMEYESPWSTLARLLYPGG